MWRVCTSPVLVKARWGQGPCVCTCVHVCVCMWVRDTRPLAWLLPSKAHNRDLQASGTAAVAPLLVQSFEVPGKPRKTQTGVKQGRGRAAVVACQCPCPQGSLALSLRDRGHASPLSPLRERSCQAKRFKVDALNNSIKRRLSSSEGWAAWAASAGRVLWGGQGRNCCWGQGGQSCSPRFVCPRRLGHAGGSGERARPFGGGAETLPGLGKSDVLKIKPNPKP